MKKLYVFGVMAALMVSVASINPAMANHNLDEPVTSIDNGSHQQNDEHRHHHRWFHRDHSKNWYYKSTGEHKDCCGHGCDIKKHKKHDHEHCNKGDRG